MGSVALLPRSDADRLLAMRQGLRGRAACADLGTMSMIATHDLSGALQRLEKLFEDKLALSRGGFESRAARARRVLPRRLQGDLTRVLAARRVEGNPKLSRITGDAALGASLGRLEAYLGSYDRADRRKGRVLSVLAAVILNAVAIFALVMAVLLWRGFV